MGMKDSDSRNPWNERAGTNRTRRDPRGQHSRSSFKSGDHWTVCQRCGFDVRSSEMREDGYREGLIVCPRCYDPKHPQDFVRPHTDDPAPEGLSAPAHDYDRTATEGSTEIPRASDYDAGLVLGTIPNQTYESGEAITSIDGGDENFPDFLDVYNVTYDAESYSVDQLPTGLSLNTTTGAITGTLDIASDAQTGMESVVSGSYSDGVVRDLDAFTWTITAGGLTPNDMGCTDWAWWDLSFAGTAEGGCWQDEARSVACTHSSVMKAVTDRSGNGHHISTSGTNLTWQDNIMSGYGAGDGSGGTGNLTTADDIALSASAWSMFVICRIDSTDFTHTIMSGRSIGAPDGWTVRAATGAGASTPAEDRKYNLRAASPGRDIVTSTQLYQGITTVGIFWFYIEVDQSASAWYENNVLDATGSGFDSTDGPCGGFRLFSAGTGGNNWRNYILEAGIFDKKLSSDQRTALWNYHDNRYSFVT